MLNKRGQTLGIAIATALFIMMIGMISINFLMPEITNARIAMNCASPSDIHDGAKLFCLMLDGTVPYWIVITFSLVIGVVTARLSL